MTDEIIEPIDITLDSLREGKFTIKDIPRKEAARLWREEYETLEEGAKEVADSTGWKPKHFFLGKKSDGSEQVFKDWKEFGDEVSKKLPLQNERLKHMTKEKLDSDAKVAKLEAQIESMTKLQRLQAERTIKKDKVTIEAEMQEAFDSGDRQGFKQAEARKAELELEEQTIKEFEPQIVKENLTPELILFKATNPWFETDIKLTRYARQASADFSREYPHLTMAQNLKLVEDDVRVNFPENFETKSEFLPPQVESGRNKITLPSGGLTFDDLPSEERERGERMIRQGITTKSAFVKGYNDFIKSNKK